MRITHLTLLPISEIDVRRGGGSLGIEPFQENCGR
jgi:hypothetical protein